MHQTQITTSSDEVASWKASNFFSIQKPVCDPVAVVQVPNARFSVLTPRVIRMEYNPEDKFEDRPSQIFWHRLQPVPLYTATRSTPGILITTDELQLRYDFGEGFSHENLSIELVRYKTVWHCGDQDVVNLKGTARTLDGADGPVPLEDGLISKSGWTVIDDSNGLVFDSSSWIKARNNGERSIDLYFFGYGKNYSSTLEDFYALSGAPGIPPRWALGNWWSRYWEYRQIELSELMEEFQRKSVPLSVCIVDMDWHLTKTGNQSSGWTGYTWNRELFPDTTGFIKFLHSLGLRTGLNLHPAEGIHPTWMPARMC